MFFGIGVCFSANNFFFFFFFFFFIDLEQLVSLEQVRIIFVLLFLLPIPFPSILDSFPHLLLTFLGAEGVKTGVGGVLQGVKTGAGGVKTGLTFLGKGLSGGKKGEGGGEEGEDGFVFYQRGEEYEYGEGEEGSRRTRAISEEGGRGKGLRDRLASKFLGTESQKTETQVSFFLFFVSFLFFLLPSFFFLSFFLPFFLPSFLSFFLSFFATLPFLTKNQRPNKTEVLTKTTLNIFLMSLFNAFPPNPLFVLLLILQLLLLFLLLFFLLLFLQLHH